jgi:hypothetical protein
MNRKVCLLGSLLTLCLLFSLATRAAAGEEDDDNWQVVTPPHEQEPANANPAQGSGLPQQQSSSAAHKDGEIFTACGERARNASPQVREIVDEINRMWNSDARVYEAVAPVGPHAKKGGCIFYNPTEMAGLLNGWMNIREAKAVQPVVIAIFAHEVGHIVHRDLDSSRANVAPEERELEADRFAGYTMSLLRIRPDNIVTYYRLTGDDFTGGYHSHGTSDQRAAAFEKGWKLAEMGSSEESVVPARGLGGP